MLSSNQNFVAFIVHNGSLSGKACRVAKFTTSCEFVASKNVLPCCDPSVLAEGV